jgi:hypothetical protein
VRNAIRSTRLGAFALVTALAAAALVVAAPHHGPEEVVLDAAANKRSAVRFPHAKHQEWVETCSTCHHTQPDLVADAAAEAKVEKCTTCHLDPEQADTPSMREMGLQKNPFHAGCIDCHKEREKGPTRCDDCHPKT